MRMHHGVQSHYREQTPQRAQLCPYTRSSTDMKKAVKLAVANCAPTSQ